MKNKHSARKGQRSRKQLKPLDVADHIHSASIRLLRGLRRQDDKWGLSAPRLSALSVVVFGGPLTLGDLARAEQVRPPTMTRLVQALESARLVTRTPDSSDARIMWIKATSKGRKLLFKGRAARVRTLSKGLESLTGEEIAQLESAAELILRVASGL
jgi:DNA-binding MarR family transcriptional regulator